MNKYAQNKNAIERARARKAGVVVEEADRLFDETWEAVMLASDQELDSMSAAVVTAQAKAKKWVVDPTNHTGRGRVFTGVFGGLLPSIARGERLRVNLKTEIATAVKKLYMRQPPKLNITRITTSKHNSDDERDYL